MSTKKDKQLTSVDLKSKSIWNMNLQFQSLWNTYSKQLQALLISFSSQCIFLDLSWLLSAGTKRQGHPQQLMDEEES